MGLSNLSNLYETPEERATELRLQEEREQRLKSNSLERILSSGKFKGILPDETISELIMNVNTDISLDKVILSKENKGLLQSFLTEHAARDKLLKYGLTPMNRILCYGASGCGKTFMGKALSNYLGYDMLYVDITTSLAKGNVAENLSNIFKLATVGKCIVFLDECDSIAWNRDSSNAERGDVRRATNSLFQYIDQLTPNSILLCATNMLQRLDPAFERRFNIKMQFLRPQIDFLEAIHKFLFDDFTLENDVSEVEISIVRNRLKDYTKLSYFELQDLTERGMKKAVIQDSTVVKLSWIVAELETILRLRKRFKIEDE